MFLFQAGKRRQTYCEGEGGAFCCLSFEELPEHAEAFGIPHCAVESILHGARNTRHESHEDYDFLALCIPNDADSLRPPTHVCVYFRRDFLALLSREEGLFQPLCERLAREELPEGDLSSVLFLFLEMLTNEDAGVLAGIESEISALEEDILTSRRTDCIGEIVAFRKRIMVLKRYYDQLADLCDSLVKNENELFSRRAQRNYRILGSRVNRLLGETLNLREYITQVREAYEAQVDIRLNTIMKLFTVITAIFLPLTLIVGWYGMNVDMPEYHWAFGYPFVILLSLSSLGICLYLFKKNKWF